ncbi:MAG: hypothetical protein J2P45_08050 [Candidatus Dormibacteraeota bacterium]|nr:hypothetical protein [Candidatus Dormibacteraeota bacterium]
MADGIIFERLGLQTASILTDAFTQSASAMAKTMGAEGYRYSAIPHPLSSLSTEECHARAGEILPEILDILGVGNGETSTHAPEIPPAAAAANGSAAVSIDDLSEEAIADARRIVEHYYQRGWTDGLPVAPVGERTLKEFLDYAGRDPDEVLLVASHLSTKCTVRQAAIAAAMAGCRKELFPTVLSVVGSMQPHTNTGLMQSTTGQAMMIVVNGPVRNELDINGATSVFGPGHRGNATLGRAVRLVIMNALGIRPGEFDQSTQGTPGKYVLCIGENEEDSPWEPLHVERGFARESSVSTVLFARSTLHVEQRQSPEPEHILLTIADSMSYAGGFAAGRGYVVVMGPEHAHQLADRGWSKQDAKRFLWEHWGRRTSDLRRLGLAHDGVTGNTQRTDGAQDDDFQRFGESPDSILLVVAGARNAGVSTVVPLVRLMAESKQV